MSAADSQDWPKPGDDDHAEAFAGTLVDGLDDESAAVRRSRLPRGTCPVCGREVALRRGGLVREHKPYNVERDSMLEAGVDGSRRPSGLCRGSGTLARV